MLCCGFKKRMENTESAQNTERNDDDVRSTTHINVLDEDFGQQEIEVRMMTTQALKLVKLCRNEYESDAIFISDDNMKCPREFMESMKYVAKYIVNNRSYNAYDQTTYHEKDDTVKDPFKNKRPPSKKKKKGKGIVERLNKKRRPRSNELITWIEKEEESKEHGDKNTIRPFSLRPDDRALSAITIEEFTKDNKGKSSLRENDSLTDETFNTKERTQQTNNAHEENSMTRQDRPPAVLFLASSLLSEQKEDYIIRQDHEMKFQIIMTEEVQRLETYCSSPNFKHSNFTQDNSLCPPAFLQSMSNIKNRFDDLRKQIEDMQLEKNDYLNRLSSVAGSMLTENNPNITDRNDPNRATKLAEKWCKIFDDEWVDALESLEKKYYKKKHEKHEQFVYHLFSLIKVIYETCREKAKEQVVTFLLLKNPCRTQVKEMWIQIPSTERQNFTDSRKRMAEANINMLQKIIINDDVYKKKLKDLNPVLDKEILGIVENSSYFEKCLEICWQFVIQDPPLFLDIRSLAGETINKDTHKEYTKSGAVIKYVVWPALYLHCKNNEKGALLAKGVVQPES